MTIPNDQVEKLLKFINDGLQNGKDFAMEQAPDIYRQMVCWNIAKYCLFLLAWSLVLIAALCTVRRFGRWISDFDNRCGDITPVGIFGGLAYVIAFCASTSGLIYSAYQALFWVMAPKLAVLEFLAEMIKR